MTNKKRAKPDKVLSGLDEHQLEEKEDNIKEYLRIRANKQRFNNLVKHQRVNREKDHRITTKIKETQRAPPMTLEEIKDDLDLGMELQMQEPKFEFVQEVDPLYVEKPIGKYEPTATNLDRMRARKQQADNRIVKKKFKAEPTTQNELRDCQVELTGEQLQKIIAGPQKINFKNVFVKSETTKSFNISNDLR